MERKLQELKARLSEISDLKNVNAVLGWDQAAWMPPGGAGARSRHMATVARLAHERQIDAALGKLLDDLQSYGESLPYESDDASLIRVARRDFEIAAKVPPPFVAEFYAHRGASYSAWAQARPANDFSAMVPYLEKTVDLSRQYAEYFPGYEHIADPLINRADYGMKASTVSSLFGELREQLVPIAQAIAAQAPADDSCLHQTFPEDAQWQFGLDVIKDFGYDFNRGRQDKAPHPFTTSFSAGDVRITTRVSAGFFSEAFFATLHEAGHGLYEQGSPMSFDGSPLAGGTSSGVHESQSRTWENVVGRSRGFWEHYYPKLRAVFPQQFGGVSLDSFYRAINKVERSLIRVEADEVTYNLHVMMRFDFELALLEGELAVKDLPEAWGARMRADLGITPPDDRDGVLQDMHWYYANVGGMFQGYTLGNIMSAQFYSAALDAHPDIPAETRNGQFGTLLGWLNDNLYRHGRKFTAAELVERVTGEQMRIEPYIGYLKGKFGELYDL